MAGKGGIIVGIITLVIGGTVFSISKADVAKNFSKDTGLSQQEAETYVGNVNKDDLVAYDKIGSDTVSDGQSILTVASEIDCVTYKYKWETNSLSCEEGKSQLTSLGDDEIALGKAYTTLASDSATKNDMSSVISLINRNNADLNLGIVSQMLDYTKIDEMKKTNSYNKAVLQTALDSK